MLTGLHRLLTARGSVPATLAVLAGFWAIWVVMNGTWAWPVLLGGVPVAFVALWGTHRLARIDYVAELFVRPRLGAGYLWILAKGMAVSTVLMVRTILTGQAEEQFFSLETVLHDELLLFLLLTAITITPGTVIFEQVGRRLTLVTMEPCVTAVTANLRRIEKRLLHLSGRPAASPSDTGHDAGPPGSAGVGITPAAPSSGGPGLL